MSDNLAQSAAENRRSGDENTAVIVGFILAVCSITLFPILSIFLAIAGIIFSGIGISICKKEKRRKRLAATGVVIGSIMFLVNIYTTLAIINVILD